MTQDLLEPFIHENSSVLADRTFDTETATSVIPPKTNQTIQREYDKEIYKNCNQIERFFNKLKHFMRIATRYDKLLASFLALVQLTSALIRIPKFPQYLHIDCKGV